MLKCLVVGVGGFCGTIIRYLITLIPWFSNMHFPLATLIINLTGSLLIGIFSGIADNVNIHWLLFFQVGLCGGFTTFSSFSMQTYQLIEEGNTLDAAIYIILSIILCLLFVWLGRYFVQIFNELN